MSKKKKKKLSAAEIREVYPADLAEVFIAHGKVRWKPGDCYRDAVNFLMEYHKHGQDVDACPATYVCGWRFGWPGTPVGEASYQHAWVEVDLGEDRVFCVDGGGVVPKGESYLMHKSREFKRFTLADVCRIVSETGNAPDFASQPAGPA